VLLGVIVCAPAARAQSPLTGANWRDREAGVEVQFQIATDRTLLGRIAWVRDPLDSLGQPARDSRNPDATLRSRFIIGLPMLTGMRQDDATHWSEGRIYDARAGKTYRASMELVHPDTLRIKGFIQIGFFKPGRTATWVRVTPARSGTP
jgi:uncharacterized protein (DUF2147 family)